MRRVTRTYLKLSGKDWGLNRVGLIAEEIFKCHSIDSRFDNLMDKSGKFAKLPSCHVNIETATVVNICLVLGFSGFISRLSLAYLTCFFVALR